MERFKKILGDVAIVIVGLVALGAIASGIIAWLWCDQFGCGAPL